ncbi:beta-glucoside-specific PTS transporter subunit IIABC [Enterococcus sp. AZ163]|uniref:beta-glucoside-specific PTS transporter subunit IIABC n=1 Tax=Enterococcus sp. AZ163 TaxID=2774638 RepID=UPI003D28919D
MTNKELARRIIEKMGGKNNITQSWHCITRLRFNVRDKNAVNLMEIKELEGVIGAQYQGGQFQIIIGNEVVNVFNEVSKILGLNPEAGAEQGAKGNPIERVFDVISGVFTPILPAIIGSGLLKGFMAILLATSLLSDQSATYLILNGISDAAFKFLPFLVAFSAAKKFQTSASVAVALAGVLMYPWQELINNPEITNLSFLGFMNVPVGNSYASSVLPIILGVWLLSFVERLAKKVVPNSLTIVFVPLICLVITAPLLLTFIAPLGTMIGTYLERFFTMLFDVAGPFAGALLGGLMPLIVITGMHYAFFPGSFASFEKFGYDIMLLPMSLVSNMAQAGATLSIFFKTKDSKMKQVAFSAFVPAMFGITEPAIYGVTMKLKKPFYASLIGGAVGGAIFGAFTVKALSFTVPGVLALPTYLDEASNNFIFALVGVFASFAVSFIMTWILKFEETETAEQAPASEVIARSGGPTHIVAPITGEVKQLADCPDATFAGEMVGKGVGIIPSEGKVVAPFDGVVTLTTETNHAIGVTSNDGVELLIHIGIDTVNLKGEGFSREVSEGDVVKLGDTLLQFDLERIQAAGLSVYSPVVVTNTADFLDLVSAVTTGKVSSGKDDLIIGIN